MRSFEGTPHHRKIVIMLNACSLFCYTCLTPVVSVTYVHEHACHHDNAKTIVYVACELALCMALAKSSVGGSHAGRWRWGVCSVAALGGGWPSVSSVANQGKAAQQVCVMHRGWARCCGLLRFMCGSCCTCHLCVHGPGVCRHRVLWTQRWGVGQG